MKVIVRTRAALLHDFELAMGMHRLRGRVFKERLDWDVSVAGGLEIDQYDSFKPTYLLALEQSDVVGCVRLLPVTDRALAAIRSAGKISGCAIDAPSSLPLAA